LFVEKQKQQLRDLAMAKAGQPRSVQHMRPNTTDHSPAVYQLPALSNTAPVLRGQ